MEVSVGSALSLVIDQLRRSPVAVAQVHGDALMSYGELAARASQVRGALDRAGAGHGSRVACFVERGLDPLVALLGTWAAGASYVPVDPSLPLARQRALVGIADCDVALRSPGIAREPTVWDGEEILLSSDFPPAAGREFAIDVDAWVMPSPDNEAYVLFTSGSTGEPKGVSVPHRASASLIGWQLAQPEFSLPRRVSQFASVSFDVSILEFLISVTSGSTLVVIPESVRRDARALMSLLIEREIEVTFLPPAVLRELVMAWDPSATPTSLRYILVGGEALVVTDTLRQFCEAACVEVVNHYGPTETHLVTYHRLGPNARPQPAAALTLVG